ncbi:hypothetical protein B0A49_04671 [Cryomyces minteri]|uniref:DNA-directed RNA polymerase III subunit RPC8 n=1 Tax=Cryomyces minteri TaxID=331657 RepID=A0A4U0WLF1_9PEZI|nr:hypothetical protein B0A49_07057 [Cryomyces minteri]TKA66954.1 hypothetical protein B0A49_04671 [Cryomyces minteri]
MYILTTIADLIQISPEDFEKKSIQALEDDINLKYANKVIQRIGLCICLYDILKSSEGLIGHGTGIVNVNVEFRLIVFRPFKGEIMQGVISSSSVHGIKNFFEDIFVPGNTNLFEGSKFNAAERTWVWTTDGQEAFFDNHEVVRFRVEAENWHDLSPQQQPKPGDAPRRWAHDAHDSTHQAPPLPANESLGKGFYIAVGLLPLSFALYKFSRMNTDEQPAFTRWINSYSNWKEKWTDRNDLHTRMIEQAGADRNLFLNTVGSGKVNLKFPEIFNTGAPWNVPAGHGGANMDKLIAHYEKENFEEQEKKMQALRDGSITAEQPVQRLGKKNPPNP